MNAEQLDRLKNGQGFIAALDQSGGSTPTALANYGIDASQYSGEEQMFDLVHAMRGRIITSPAFNSQRILAAIIFRGTMERQLEGVDTADYLWQEKGVVPFLKIDNGLADEANGVQLLKPMPELDSLLALANQKHVFGTKMRSVIKSNNPEGIAAVLDQQFEVAKQILAAGLLPIIEPEVDINATDKAQAEQTLLAGLTDRLNQLAPDQLVMLKLTLPETVDLYLPLISHPNVVRVVALSGGYSAEEANARLIKNHKMIASFSRVLAAGLNANQSPEEFDATLDATIETAFQSSLT